MTDCPLPARLAARPVVRGFLVPWVNETDDGEANFASIQTPRSLRCARERLCAICSEPLEYWIAFVGGPRCAKARLYSDPPMHEDCAEWSLRLCPYLSRRAPKRNPKLADIAFTPDGFVEDKPGEFQMYITRDFTWEHQTRTGALLYHPKAARFIRRWVYDDKGRLQAVPATQQ